MTYGSVSKPTLYGDMVSGNCLKTRWIADKTGYDYDWVDIDIMKGESRTEAFLALSTAGQVPIMQLPSGEVIEQSNAIALHIAEAAGGAFIPDAPGKRSQMIGWMFWEQYSHESAIAVRRFRKVYLGLPDSEIDPELLPKGYRALDRMEEQLDGQDWMVPDAEVTLADLSLVAYTRVAEEGGYDLTSYPRVRDWVRRTEIAFDIPHITESA